jgi:hypothetical protein
MQASRLSSLLLRPVTHQPQVMREALAQPGTSLSKNAQIGDNFSVRESSQSLRSLLSGSVGRQEDDPAQDLFKQQFTEKASNPKEFHAFMRQVFGDDYNVEKAESFRQKALAGDFSWIPKIQYVSTAELGGAHGAYDSKSGTVFLNESLKGNPSLAAQTFVEEAGHHLDAQLNKSDTAGDEGEMFRRVLSGEKLSAAQVNSIQTENDKGTITVDGKEIEVEFWNPLKAAGRAIKKVAKAVGNAVKGVAQGVGRVLEGVGEGVQTFFTGIGEGVGGFLSNAFRGKFGDAFEALLRGADKAFLQAPTRLLNGVLNGVEDAAHGLLHLLGPLHGPFKGVFNRVFDAARSLVTGGWDTATSVVRNVVEGATGALRAIGDIFTGNFGEGFKKLGTALWDMTGQNIVDAALLGLGRGVSAIQTLVGLEAPGRRLTDAEIAILRDVYGDSIDYDAIRIKEGDAGLFSTNNRPFCHGNTIYMKDSKITPELLIHETAHVWQHQNGGADYMTDALISQEFGHGYDWEVSVPGTPWEDLEPEQQAELLETAYAEGYFTSGTFRNPELSAYMDEAIRKLRSGEGAP